MKRMFVTLALLSTFVFAATASSAEFPTGVAEPWQYDPDNTGTVVAEWDEGGTILILQKNAPTPTNSAAGASLLNAAGSDLTDISFDVRGYCNNGAPRVNVYWGESWDNYSTGFFGCARSLDTETTEDGWLRVAFNCDSEVGVPDEATGCGENILGIELVMDEEGQTDLRNIVVNGLFYGPAPVTETPEVASQMNRLGYCTPKPVERYNMPDGRFVDLFAGQPTFDSRYAGAVLAYYLEGQGISCEIPSGYFLDGTKTSEGYPFAKKV